MFTLNCKGRVLALDKPLLMGVINTTPDSFFSDSRSQSVDAALRQAGQMLEAGANILDMGGQSTRPGSQTISAAEELQRLIKPLAAIHQNFPDAIISVDTFYGRVAAEAAAAGASIVNDTSAGQRDVTMIETVAKLRLPYVLMHSGGIDMQQETITATVLDFFIKMINHLRQCGIPDIIIDPGFGFGKTTAQNFELLRDLGIFKMLDCPLLLGVSRKSSIYKTLGITPAQALNGTTVLHTIGLLNGAQLLRVHDIREAKETIQLLEVYNTAG